MRDGMNLVAKEFVAAQDPEDPGVLVLSRFAGAAQQLTGALIVNPYDRAGMARALETALRMPLDERRRRWRHMMSTIAAGDVSWWVDQFHRKLAEAPSANGAGTFTGPEAPAAA
jgi:trehalose 6-phosphate synthase